MVGKAEDVSGRRRGQRLKLENENGIKRMIIFQALSYVFCLDVSSAMTDHDLGTLFLYE